MIDCTLPAILFEMIFGNNVLIDDLQIYNSLYSESLPSTDDRLLIMYGIESAQITNVSWEYDLNESVLMNFLYCSTVKLLSLSNLSLSGNSVIAL